MSLLLRGNKEKQQKLAHILAAVIILIHAYEKYEMKEPSYVFFLVSGILFLTVAIMHGRLSSIFPYVDGVFFVIEAMVYAVIAVDYFQMGKRALPWSYVAIAIAYLVAAYVKGKRGKEKHSKANKNPVIKS